MRGDPPQLAHHIPAELWSTPHARGSTHCVQENEGKILVYPACAGIHLLLKLLAVGEVGLPRMRGDPPSIFI